MNIGNLDEVSVQWKGDPVKKGILQVEGKCTWLVDPDHSIKRIDHCTCWIRFNGEGQEIQEDQQKIEGYLKVWYNNNMIPCIAVHWMKNKDQSIFDYNEADIDCNAEMNKCD